MSKGFFNWTKINHFDKLRRSNQELNQSLQQECGKYNPGHHLMSFFFQQKKIGTSQDCELHLKVSNDKY